VKKVETLKGRDKEIAKQLIGIEIDAMNIMILLRTIHWRGKIDPDLIIPYFYHLSEKLVNECAKCDSLEDVITKLSKTPYGKILNQSLENYRQKRSLLSFELSLKKYCLEKNENFLRGDPFQIGTLLGYLKLKEVEIENLRAIAVGIENKLPEEEIEKLILT
jgi:V/A-type H+-transporting ATPase subunit C